MFRAIFLKISFLGLVVLGTISAPAFAVDPQGIEGTYKFPPVDVGGFPFVLPINVNVTGVSGSEYQVSLAQNLTLPIVGCQLTAGFVYVKLTSQGGNTYLAETTFFKNALCQLETKSPKQVTLVKQSNGVLLDFIETNEVDQFFERVGVSAQDTTAPTVTNKGAKGSAGSKIKLNYQTSDDSGQTSEVIEIYLGKRLVKSIFIALGIRAQGAKYFVKWKAPLKGKGKAYKFLVRSTDAAGNVSATPLKKITIN